MHPLRMTGTNVAYCATRAQPVYAAVATEESKVVGEAWKVLPSYALATRCPALTLAFPLSGTIQGVRG